ncbi:DNA repair-scaffolding protein-like [Dysidea avara]|uniref:DNA repair-scaffolding protein-like n=1 Tax=Dysidea avara TaxID=196820 RepID=UPI00331F2873
MLSNLRVFSTMEGRKKGISAFARQSLQSEPWHSRRSSRKRPQITSSLQHDVDSILDSSDSCHSDSSVGVSRKRKRPAANTSHHHVTPYDKVLAESIDQFGSSSEDDIDLDDNVDHTADDQDHHDFDLDHVDGRDQQSRVDDCDDSIDVDANGVNKGTDSKVLLQERDEDSPSINSVASSPDVCTANQIMTSDWLKGVVMATPESKSTTPVKGSSSGCSKVARRRVSFVRCGLAEQLDRLLSQQRSEKTLWYHQVFRQHDHQAVPAGSLGVKLISLMASYSVFIAQAHVIQESGCSTRPHNGEVITILFDAETVKVLKLQSRSCVFVCPPWQSITIQGSHLVLLSTHFCMPFTDDAGTYTDYLLDDVTSVAITIGQPDNKDVSFLEQLSPNINASFYQHEQQQENKDSPKEPEDGTNKNKSFSVLEAIEQAQYGRFALTAKVWRVFCRKTSYRVAKQFSSSSLTQDLIQSARNYHQDGSSIRWVILVKDGEGVWSEILADSEQVTCSEEWKQLVSGGEGCTHRFTDLRVVARTTKITNPETFSLISSLQEMAEKPTGVTFCYQLFTTGNVQQLECTGAKQIMSLKTTGDLAQPHPSRVTLHVMVIHFNNESDICRLLVATSGSNMVTTVHVKPGCVLNHRLATANGSYVLIRDACNSGNYTVYCDSCTLVVPTDQYGNLTDVDNLYPRILCTVEDWISPIVIRLSKTNCSVGQLVAVKGTVIAVDEDNASYLPLCNSCNGHLQESKERELFCNQCQVAVNSPGITIELAVYLTDHELPHYTIHVQLHRVTTSKLLPIDYSAAEEGLDINQVLNRTLLLKACHILSTDDTMMHMEEVDWTR